MNDGWTRALHLALAIGMVTAIACGPPKIKRTDMCQTMLLPMADPPPSRGKLESGQARVVVTQFAEKEWAGLANGVVSATEQNLASAGVLIVDRGATKQLVGEVRLAEVKGARQRYKGPEVADNVVVVRVSSSDVTGQYVEEVRNEGKAVSPAQCKITGTMTGSLRIYRIPDMLAVRMVELNGSATDFESARGQNCQARGANTTLKRRAADAAITAVSAELKNFFAPVGYVLERRRCSSEGDIFKLSIGTNSGLKAGDEVGVFTVRLNENPLTHAVALEEEKIASGVVSDQAYSTYAWLAGVTTADAERIHLGDYIQVFYKTALGVKARRFFSNTFRGGE